MNINELTIGQVKEVSGLFGSSKSNKTPFKIGTAYLIRTVTHIQTGIVREVCGNFIVLSDSAWIADTGRFHDALKTGDLNEVEPFPDGCIVSCGAIIDATVWVHDLPGEQR